MIKASRIVIVFGILGLCFVGAVAFLRGWVVGHNDGVLFSPPVMADLYISLLTLIATVFVAVLIYLLQVWSTKDKAKDRGKNERRILAGEIETGLKEIVRNPRAYYVHNISSSLSDMLLAYLPDIQKEMKPEETHLLIRVADILSNVAKISATGETIDADGYLEHSMHEIVQEQFLPAMFSRYSECFSDLADFQRMLLPELQALLRHLKGKKNAPIYEKTQTLADSVGRVRIAIGEGERIRCYDEYGGLLCDAVLDDDYSDGVKSGWAKSDKYEAVVSAAWPCGAGERGSAEFVTVSAVPVSSRPDLLSVIIIARCNMFCRMEYCIKLQRVFCARRTLYNVSVYSV